VENHYFCVALAKSYAAQNEFSKAEEQLQSAWAVKEHFLGAFPTLAPPAQHALRPLALRIGAHDSHRE
jgi:hypothetical protein